MGNPYRIPLAIVLVILTSPFATAAEPPFLVLPEGPANVSISRSGEPYLDLEFVGWGPQWAWMGWEGQLEESGNAAKLINRAKAANAEISLAATVRQTHPRRLQIQIDLSTTRDTPLTYIVASLALAEHPFAKSTVQAVQADGTKQDRQLPLDKSGLGTHVTHFTVRDDGASDSASGLRTGLPGRFRRCHPRRLGRRAIARQRTRATGDHC